MRNLWLFFIKYYASFLFIALEAIAFSMVISNHDYQRSTVVNSSRRIAGSFYEGLNRVTDYISLSRVNDSLIMENTRLKNYLRSSFYNLTPHSAMVKDSVYMHQYQYTYAKVINNSTLHRNNYLTLDRGSMHGIRKNMGVISPNGIVGIVKDVSKHYCTVISLLHKDSRISAEIKSTRDFGSLVWNGFNPRIATLTDIPSHVRLKKGDIVTTTSFSKIFPEGIMIGTVEDFEIKEGDNFYKVDVRLSTEFSRLNYVYVITNILALEQTILEQNLKYD